ETKHNPWPLMTEGLLETSRALVIGRGASLPIAFEAALKMKETCGIHAEAFSSAEVRHGPQAIIEAGYPVIIFALPGPTQNDLLNLATELKKRGARIFLIAPEGDYKTTTTLHHDLDPMLAIYNFYF